MDPELKKWADKIYNVGFKNGQIDMQSRVLKSINRDFSLVTYRPMNLIMRVLKKVNKLPIKSYRTRK